MTRIYRVVVRGQFADLDEPTRERLLREAPEHDIFRSAFTTEGTFTYDTRLVAFNLRYEVRVAEDPAGDDDSQAVALARSLDRAAAWLATVGLGHRHLRATATDMAAMWR